MWRQNSLTFGNPVVGVVVAVDVAVVAVVVVVLLAVVVVPVVAGCYQPHFAPTLASACLPRSSLH